MKLLLLITLKCVVVGKRSHILKQTCSVTFLLPPRIKGFILFQLNKINMNRYKSKFLDQWLVNAQFKSWIKKEPDDKHSAYCNYCCKTLFLAGQGIYQILSHMTGSKYKSKLPHQRKESTQTVVNVSTPQTTSQTS